MAFLSASLTFRGYLLRARVGGSPRGGESRGHALAARAALLDDELGLARGRQGEGEAIDALRLLVAGLGLEELGPGCDRMLDDDLLGVEVPFLKA
jgi:hypothetical protein